MYPWGKNGLKLNGKITDDSKDPNVQTTVLSSELLTITQRPIFQRALNGWGRSCCQQ